MDVGPSPQRSRKRKPRFRLTRPIVLEHPLQTQITKLLAIEIAPPGMASAAGVLWYAIDHANYAGEVPGVRVGRGIISGIPDLYLLHRGNAHHIELKTVRGTLTDDQEVVGEAILDCGGKFGVARSAEEVLALIDEWRIPRHRRTTL